MFNSCNTMVNIDIWNRLSVVWALRYKDSQIPSGLSTGTRFWQLLYALNSP